MPSLKKINHFANAPGVRLSRDLELGILFWLAHQYMPKFPGPSCSVKRRGGEDEQEGYQEGPREEGRP